GYRHYAPWLARWLNPDPAGTVDGLNLYRMVRNNPITLVDSNGTDPRTRADKAYEHMFGWKAIPGAETEERHHYGGIVWQGGWGHSRNYQGIVENTRVNIGDPISMNPTETAFFERFRSSSFYAVHFSRSDFRQKTGDIVFRSGVAMREKNPEWESESTGGTDLQMYGTDDFAFFSLEIGQTPKKETSRFGEHRYRIPFSRVLSDQYGKYSVAQINDLLDFKRRSDRSLPEWLKSNPEAMRAYREPVATKEAEILYATDRLVEGIGIRLIKDFRRLPAAAQEQALSASSESELDFLLNKFYRPQILIPKKLSLSRGQYQYAHVPRRR
ncbi:RHS repeat-associated core domain-containing protein, partial [Burkholderia ubonensis]|uniref:RHS repeat-associated core domain-containing protein n=1 Tax=Burkholderia ubonensis TaxID=101571 RepID=UPI000AE83010